ncbi:MAG TPA: GNAT family protein [Thermomicrobiales bacterium]
MIVGKRVTLRPFQPEDLPALRTWHDDAGVMQYWGDRHPILAAHAFEADLAPNGRFTQFAENGYFGICDESGRLIGRVEYEGFKLPERAAELSILIGEKETWSKGYGSEAVTLLLEWLFNDRGAHRVWLVVFPENTRAQRAYEKVGFVREGTLRETWIVDGRWHDEHVYGMLRRDYNARYHPEREKSH